jgi:hypothetical protein
MGDFAKAVVDFVSALKNIQAAFKRNLLFVG